ncbi:MAG: 6,7-dimethyl-8-ribityllumazine synthase [Acidimicrobiia bacterium]
MAEIVPPFDARGMRVGIVVAEFNGSVTQGLLRGALEALDRAGAPDPTVVRVPGAFELPVVARALVEAGHDCVVALGAVILGETDHYHHVATQTAAGLQQVAVDTGVPVAFGVLTTRTASQAVERSIAGPANKGAEAAEAAVRAALGIRSIKNL